MQKLQLSRRNFHQLVRKMDNPEFPSDESLLKFLFGTPSAMAVFIELMKWLPYSKRPDGSIYKSDAQLAAAIRRSAKSVGRARPILKEAGFTIYIKKANGTPTNHYRFDLERFLAFVASKVKLEVEKVREWLVGAQKPASDQISRSADVPAHTQQTSPNLMSKSPQSNAQADVDISSRSSTSLGHANLLNTNLGNATTDKAPPLQRYGEAVVDSSSLKMEILSIGSILKVRGDQVNDWVVRYGIERVKAVARRAVEDAKVRNPGGWARMALENNFQWAEKAAAPVRRKYADYART